ncbi:hypothetical protein YA0089_26395 [Pseudomonas viridiflava]|uniref:hypothetical protein n=1 Tax=Pseudomonas viridiflava TaxID=33069 RepID=UPI0018E5EE8E|nr:hypothetical protein [Pseudomonas viridiflava]MBI6727147.1 hypothetical protein [Pseudomonas viridiflava]
MKIMTVKTFQGASCAMLMLCLAAFSNASEVKPKDSTDQSRPLVSKSMLIGIKAEVAELNSKERTLNSRVIENGVVAKMTDYGSGYNFDIVGLGSEDLKTVRFNIVATQKNAPPATSYNIVAYQDINVGSEFILPLGGGKDQRYLVLGVTSITPAPIEEKDFK